MVFDNFIQYFDLFLQDEFCTYMQLEYEEKEDAYLRQKEVDIHTPASTEHMPHRDSVLRITNMSDGTFAAVSQVWWGGGEGGEGGWD